MKKAKRFLSMLLTLSLCVGEFSFTGIRASAEGEKTITGLGTGAITDPVIPEAETDAAWSGSFVYYGKYKGQPVKYRVLDKASGDFGVSGRSLFLDCDSVLEAKRFDDHSKIWTDSEVRSWLNGEDFLLNDAVFNDNERSAIASSSKTGYTIEEEYNFWNGGYDKYIDYGLTGEKIFLMDKSEAEKSSYGYSSNSCRIKKDGTGAKKSWWLRIHHSYYHNYNQYSHEENCVGCVYEDGFVSSADCSDVNMSVSPALNVELNAVLFSSLISGDPAQPGAEYKLTLKDSGLKITTDKAERSDDKILIPYAITDSSTGADPTQVSVVVTDGTWTDNGWSDGAKLLQYTKLDMDSFSSEGSGTFTPNSSVIGTWGTNYHVYLLAEDVNGEYESDYASAPVEVKELIEAKYSVSFNMNGKEGTAPAAKHVTEGGKVSAPTDVPVVTGYTLEGWYKEAACTNKWDFANDTVTADITLFAKWIPVSYTVKYDPNKPAAALSEVSGTTEDSTHTYDEAKNLSANGYSLEGYSFSSWNTVADGSGTEYAGGASVKNLADTEGAIITLYAQWK
ncbi:MAG: InlB B-repeat-containing protein, partial [Lachnospiraceae bacterium]|nr:InlB B-repeat-containing protein [Lachnospiraceae bacterium]